MNFRFLFAILLLGMVHVASAQELDPRAYQPAPVGLNAFTFSYTHSTGDILFEPSFPAKDVQANLNIEAAGYYRTFGVFGHFANASVGIPYASGHLSGTVEGVPAQIYRSGLGDLRARFSLNVKGTPAMNAREFMAHQRKTNVGVSMTISAPTGQYDPSKVVNIGQNRWGFKPEMGLSKVMNKFQIDLYGAAWFFTENDNFKGKVLTQKPVGSFQFHLSYNLRPRLWFGMNANYYTGGRTSIDGVEGTLVQKNSRLGATVAIPAGKTQQIKFAVSNGVLATRGGNYTSIGASYNYSWGLK